MYFLRIPSIAFAMFAISGCGSNKQLNSSKISKAPVLSSAQQGQLNNGTDFFAKGNTPATWSIEMDFENFIRFKSLDGTTQNSSMVKPQQLATVEKYLTKATNGFMEVFIYNEGCTTVSDDEKNNKKVEVMVNGIRYEGCGQYLYDPNLNGSWSLYSMNNMEAKAADFTKGLPNLIFELAKGNMRGNDGCNSISSSITVTGNRIRFASITSTKMFCANNNPSFDFVSKLNNEWAVYSFESGLLKLYLPDDSSVYFKKNS
jgi:heat shock protein HslJ